MKVLNVNISIDPISGGGTAERILQISRFLAQKKIDCTILTFNSNLTAERRAELKSKKIRVVSLPCLTTRFQIPAWRVNIIKNLIKETDVIHLMNHWSALNSLVYYFARYYKKPYIVCPAGALPIMGRSQTLKKIYNFFIGKKLIKNANGHIAVAENEYEQYQSYGISKEKITLIPNGIAIDSQVDQHECASFDLPTDYILFMGRLNHIKGPDILLQAFSQLPQEYQHYHLVFAGPDGGMLTTLQKMVSKFNLNKQVHFTGGVTGLKKDCLYQNCKFLVIPSRQEAMSIVVLEAGIYRKPVLLTDRCGFDCLDNIKGGVVTPATQKGIEQGLITMLTNSGNDRMGFNLNMFITNNYTWDIVGEKLTTLLKQVAI